MDDTKEFSANRFTPRHLRINQSSRSDLGQPISAFAMQCQGKSLLWALADLLISTQ